MPINLAKQKANVGNVVYQWTVKEYEKHDRGGHWLFFVILFNILTFIFGLWTNNYLFIIVVVLFDIVLFLQHHQHPRDVTVSLTETGIVVGNKYYKFNELENFWIVYNPPVKILYFNQTGALGHRMSINLLQNDPRPIRVFLAQFLDEDVEQEEESFSDRMTRLFKLY